MYTVKQVVKNLEKGEIKMIRIKRKQKENKKMMFVVLSVVLICLLIIKGIWFSPLSDAKAIQRTNTNIQKGWYCSGYNNNNADGTRIVVFRDNVTDKIVDSFEVSWDMGEKIYYKEV